MEVCHHYVSFFAWFTSLDSKKDWKLKKPGLRNSLFAWNQEKSQEKTKNLFILIIIDHLVHRALGCAITVETQSNLFIGVTTTNSFCNPIVVAAGWRNRCFVLFAKYVIYILAWVGGGEGWNKLFFLSMQAPTWESPERSWFPDWIVWHKDEVNRDPARNYRTSDPCVGEFVQPCAVSFLLSPVSLGEAIMGTMVTKIEQMM